MISAIVSLAMSAGFGIIGLVTFLHGEYQTAATLLVASAIWRLMSVVEKAIAERSDDEH